MKKILSILAFLLISVTFAQTQTFNTKVKLNNVPEGSATDSVLVRGSDGIIKYVKKSDLIPDSPAPSVPNLTQVLIAGSTTSGQIIQTGMGQSNTTSYNGTFIHQDDFSGHTSVDQFGFVTYKNTGKYAALEYNNGLELRTNTVNGSAKLKSDFLTDSKNITFQFPNKANGTYTVATTADIPAQTIPSLSQVTANGNVTSDAINANGGVNSTWNLGNASFAGTTGDGDIRSLIFNSSGDGINIPVLSNASVNISPIEGANINITGPGNQNGSLALSPGSANISVDGSLTDNNYVSIQPLFTDFKKEVRSNLEGFKSVWPYGEMNLGGVLFDGIKQFKFNSYGDGVNVPTTTFVDMYSNPDEGMGFTSGSGGSASGISISSASVNLNAYNPSLGQTASMSFSSSGLETDSPITLSDPALGYKSKLRNGLAIAGDIELELPSVSGVLAIESNTIPITGTPVGSPITGDLELDNANAERFIKGNAYGSYIKFSDDGTISINDTSSDIYLPGVTSRIGTGIEGNIDFSSIDETNLNIYAQRSYVKQEISISKPYKVYTARLDYAPDITTTVFQDEIGGIIWTSDAPSGALIGTFNVLPSLDKLWQTSSGFSADYNQGMQYDGTSTTYLTSRLLDNSIEISPTTYVEIRVYN